MSISVFTRLVLVWGKTTGPLSNYPNFKDIFCINSGTNKKLFHRTENIESETFLQSTERMVVSSCRLETQTSGNVFARETVESRMLFVFH